MLTSLSEGLQELPSSIGADLLTKLTKTISMYCSESTNSANDDSKCAIPVYACANFPLRNPESTSVLEEVVHFSYANSNAVHSWLSDPMIILNSHMAL